MQNLFTLDLPQKNYQTKYQHPICFKKFKKKNIQTFDQSIYPNKIDINIRHSMLIQKLSKELDKINKKEFQKNSLHNVNVQKNNDISTSKRKTQTFTLKQKQHIKSKQFTNKTSQNYSILPIFTPRNTIQILRKKNHKNLLHFEAESERQYKSLYNKTPQKQLLKASLNGFKKDISVKQPINFPNMKNKNTDLIIPSPKIKKSVYMKHKQNNIIKQNKESETISPQCLHKFQQIRYKQFQETIYLFSPWIIRKQTQQKIMQVLQSI